MPLFTSELSYSDDYPTIEPSLRLDFANARALDPRITFTRASTATYVGRDGLIKTVGNNEPRFDHDPDTGESLGLLIEESRTNLIDYSTDFQNQWAGGSATNNQTLAPDGTSTAAKYAAAATVSLNKTYTSTSRPNTAVKFNLATGTYDSTIVGTPTDYDIEPYGNGWYRCYFSVSSTTFSVFAKKGELDYIVIQLSNINSFIYARNATDNNTSTSDGIYIWGAQIEVGSFPTSYIPTSGSTATRAVDTAQINGIQFHNPSEFVLYAAGRSNTGASDTSSSTTGCLVSLGDTSNNYRFMLRKYRYNPGDGVNTGFTFRYRNVNDGINMDMFPNYYDGLADGYDTTTIAPIWDDFNIHRSALAFEAGVSTDNIRGCADGTLVVPAVTTPGSYSTVSNPTPYTQATTLQIGNGSSAGPFNGTINEVRYYPKRLTNTQLQTLTQ